MDRNVGTDVFSRSKRSEVMSRIRGKDTKPELILRRALFAAGFRYRLHAKTVPGKPDLVFPKYRAVVFVNGCFWHGHKCALFRWPRGNALFWRAKIEANVIRDRFVRRQLRTSGWRVSTVWECEFRRGRHRRLAAVVTRLSRWLRADEGRNPCPTCQQFK
jgi:DNA mismatch endonuclease (patch repair protein)